jgi:hypothetical protein
VRCRFAKIGCWKRTGSHENSAERYQLKQSGRTEHHDWKITDGVRRTGNTERSKSNQVIRSYLDDLIKPLPIDADIFCDSICTKVNAEDKRRRYSVGAIASLLREREDVKKVKGQWRKVGAGRNA